MGSPKVTNVKPKLPMAEDKRSIKNILKKPFQALFQKDKQKKEKIRHKNAQEEVIKPIENKPTPVAVLLEKLNQLEIQKKEPIKEEEEEDDDYDDEEFHNFSYKVIKDDNRTARINSESSGDSGYTDAHDDKEDKNLIEAFSSLKVDGRDKTDNDDDKSGKKYTTVLIKRTPVRNRVSDFTQSTHPYSQEKAESVYRQANKQTLTGGQVIVNANARTNNSLEIDLAIKQIDFNVKCFTQNSQQEQVDRWQIAQEFVNDIYKNNEDLLSDFIDPATPNYDSQITSYTPNIKSPTPNPIEEFSTLNHTFDYDIDLPIIDGKIENPSIFPTPPRSENVPSPMSDSQSFYPTNSDYTRSPETSSPLCNSDYEKYQDITSEEFPLCVTDNVDSDKESTDKKVEQTSKSMTLKQFKDLQKEIASNFAKKECCQKNRKPCKDIFTEHLKKLPIEERKKLSFNVANLELESCYGVLIHVLLNLSNDKDEDMNMFLLVLICEKVLGLKPILFVGDFGLNLLKSAVLDCKNRPILTRYLVQCVRAAVRIEAFKSSNDYVFSESHSSGDNMVIACVRAGDQCADVLAELVRCDDGEIPLFNIHHVNTEGHTALHVCCSEHSSSAPRAHCLHVLLAHGGADLWRGDVKGGDTPLHLAVNSANCDLNIIMILFHQIDRKEWKKLAQVPNRSSIRPLEYARSATKSATRQNYPVEVLDFLKKCR